MEKKRKSSIIGPGLWKKYNPNKLAAVKRYTRMKGLSLEDLLEDLLETAFLKELEKLFKKYVPPDVRKYVEPVVEEVPEAQDRPSEGTETN